MALAQANGWDVTLVRILAVLGFFFSSGLVGVAYMAAWIGIPEETSALSRRVSSRNMNGDYRFRMAPG